MTVAFSVQGVVLVSSVAGAADFGRIGKNLGRRKGGCADPDERFLKLVAPFSGV